MLYVSGLEVWPVAAAPTWILCGAGYTPSPLDEWVADLVDELVDASYSRQAATGWASTIGPGSLGDAVLYSADDPVWVALGGAVDVAWLVLAEDVTTDADSPLLACSPVAWVPDLSDFAPELLDGVVHEHTPNPTLTIWPG